MGNGLFVANEPSENPTFESMRGVSNIDITLCHESAIPWLKSWKVMAGWTSSDHNAILIDLESMSREHEIAERMLITRFLVV